MTVEVDSPIDVLIAGGPEGGPRADSVRRNPAEGVDAPRNVSEGAYVSKPSYLEHRPSRWRLAAEECGHCGTITFPTRTECRHCGRGDRLTQIELPRAGLVVEAVTTIRPGAQPTEFDPQVEQEGEYSVVIARTA